MSQPWFRRVRVLVGISVLLPLVSCNTALPEPRQLSGVAAFASPEDKPGRAAEEGAASVAESPFEQKLIRNAEIELEVKSVERAIEEIESLAKAHGGLVAGAEVTHGSSGHRHGTLTLRVPSARFDETLERLRAFGETRREKVAIQDVTKAYADLETRLAVKRQTEQRVRDLLKTRAGTLAEVLEAERELDRVVAEIERLLGEKRYYDHQIAMSNLVVGLREPGAIVRPGLLDPIRTAYRSALEVLTHSVAALIYLAVFLVPWIVVTCVLWLVVRWIVKRRRRGSTA